jgi:hypothetical protein
MYGEGTMKRARREEPKRELRALEERELLTVVGGTMPDGNGHGKGGHNPGGGGGKSD